MGRQNSYRRDYGHPSRTSADLAVDLNDRIVYNPDSNICGGRLVLSSYPHIKKRETSAVQNVTHKRNLNTGSREST